MLYTFLKSVQIYTKILIMMGILWDDEIRQLSDRVLF